jgi:hypothetical protein
MSPQVSVAFLVAVIGPLCCSGIAGCGSARHAAVPQGVQDVKRSIAGSWTEDSAGNVDQRGAFREVWTFDNDSHVRFGNFRIWEDRFDLESIRQRRYEVVQSHGDWFAVVNSIIVTREGEHLVFIGLGLPMKCRPFGRAVPMTQPVAAQHATEDLRRL